MGGIFISYRREDSSGYAIPLYDRLVQRFGRDQVFKDIEGIPPGTDFVEWIERKVGSCDVLVAMVGKKWLRSSDETGKRRLDDTKDFVLNEIKTALERNIRVIPVLVGGAMMPKAEDLPGPLVKLARRHAMEISDNRFHADMDTLIQSLEDIVPPVPNAKDNKPGWIIPAGILVAVIAIIVTIALTFTPDSLVMEPSQPPNAEIEEEPPIPPNETEDEPNPLPLQIDPPLQTDPKAPDKPHSTPPVPTKRPGILKEGATVLAPYTNDGCLYKGTVDELDKDGTVIYFGDFTDTKVLPKDELFVYKPASSSNLKPNTKVYVFPGGNMGGIWVPGVLRKSSDHGYTVSLERTKCYKTKRHELTKSNVPVKSLALRE